MAIPNWLSLSQVSGSGDTVITITADTYTELTARTASLVISGHTKSVTVPVTQDAYVPPQPDYLTLTAGSSGGVVNWKLVLTSTGQTRTISYSKNGTDWYQITSSTGGTTVVLNPNESIKLKGTNSSYGKYNQWWNGFEDSTGIVKVSGNIMSLIKGDNFEQDPNFSNSGTSAAFLKMFRNMTSLQSSGELVLPSDYVPTYGYAYLFAGCSNMTDCPSELPATGLTTQCYDAMFANCSGITTAPVLVAQTIRNYCYDTMFWHCSSLNYIKCLATNPSPDTCEGWVTGVAASGTFVKDASTTWGTGTSSIPSGWTVVNV